MSPFPRPAGALPLLAALVAAAGACGDDGKGITTAPSAASVRLVQAVPDAGGVDVLVDGRPIGTDIHYKQSIDYTPLTAGSHVVAVRATGTSSDAFSAPIALGTGASYTIVARGRLSATGGTFGVGSDVLLDDAAPATGRVSLRVLHAAPGAVPVDVFLTAPGVALGTVTPTINALSYGGGGSYANDVLAGSYELRVTRSGTTDVLADLPALLLTPGQARTVIVVGDPTLTQPIELLSFVDRTASP